MRKGSANLLGLLKPKLRSARNRPRRLPFACSRISAQLPIFLIDPLASARRHR